MLFMKGFAQISTSARNQVRLLAQVKKLAFEEPKQHRLKGGGKTWVWPNIKLRDYTKPDDED